MNFFQDLITELTEYYKGQYPGFDIGTLIEPVDKSSSRWKGMPPEKQKLYVQRHEARTLLERYISLLFRQIPRQKYKVFFSKEYIKALESPSITTTMKKSLQEIQHALEHGEDLSGRLDKTSAKLTKDDIFLEDWGFYHLHLGARNANPKAKFYGRTNMVLVLYVEPATRSAYFITVMDHTVQPGQNRDLLFADPSLLHIALDNWPDIFDKVTVPGAIHSEVDVSTPQDISQLRSAHINTLQQVNGKVFLGPGGGYTGSGTSLRVALSTNGVMRALTQETKACRDRLTQETSGMKPPQYADYQLSLEGECLCIFHIPGGEKVSLVDLRNGNALHLER